MLAVLAAAKKTNKEAPFSMVIQKVEWFVIWAETERVELFIYQQNWEGVKPTAASGTELDLKTGKRGVTFKHFR